MSVFVRYCSFRVGVF